MPEGPEVKVMANQLRHLILGYTLDDCDVDDKSKYAGTFVKPHLDSTVSHLYAYGKKLIIELKDDQDRLHHIIFSFGLEGQFHIRSKEEHDSRDKHSNMWFDFSTHDNEKKANIRIYFNDKRHFGNVRVATSSMEYNEIMSDVGKDWLTDDITLEEYKAVIQTKKIQKRQLCQFLMEQDHFSGVGNYLKSDILYQAKLHPERLMSSLSDEEIKALYDATLDRIQTSYKQGGATIRTYVDVHGEYGKYIPILYGRETDEEGNNVIQIKTKDKRTSYVVPSIQK